MVSMSTIIIEMIANIPANPPTQRRIPVCVRAKERTRKDRMEVNILGRHADALKMASWIAGEILE